MAREVDWTWETVDRDRQDADRRRQRQRRDLRRLRPDEDRAVRLHLRSTQTDPRYIGSFLAGGRCLAATMARPRTLPDSVGRRPGSGTYDAMWGDTPIHAQRPRPGSPEFAAGNPFNSGKVAMVDSPSSGTPAASPTPARRGNLGILPAYARQGQRPASTPTPSASGRTPRTRKRPSKSSSTSWAMRPSNWPPRTVVCLHALRSSRPSSTASASSSRGSRTGTRSSRAWPTRMCRAPKPTCRTTTKHVDRITKLETLIQNEKDVDVAAEAATLQTDLQAIFDKAQ